MKAPQAPDGVTTVGAVITVKSVDGLEAKVETTLTVLPTARPSRRPRSPWATSAARPTSGSR